MSTCRSGCFAACSILFVAIATVGCSQSPHQAAIGTWTADQGPVAGLADAFKLKSENPDASGSEIMGAVAAMRMMALTLNKDKTAQFQMGVMTLNGKWKLDSATRQITLDFDASPIDASSETAPVQWTAMLSKDYSAIKVYMVPPESMDEVQALGEGQDIGILMRKN